MAKSADKVVSLAELRFKPANSNDAARAVLAHHFVNVPRCSFARDDGISAYLGSETGMDTFPASPDSQAPRDIDIPGIQSETPDTSGGLRRKLLRGGFALSVFLHAAAAAAICYVTLSLPDEAPLEEGITSVTFVVEGNADADARAAGAEEEIEKPEDKPVETEVKPVEKPIEAAKPVPATTETVLKDVPLPTLGADLPEILTTQQESAATTEVVAKPAPTEEKIEQPVEKPVTPLVAEKPKPIEKQPQAKKEEPKKQPDKKEKPREKRKQNRGDQGNQASNAKRGETDSDNQGQASTNSRGDSSNREIGNAARTNYRGLVNRKLSRAKGRIASPGKGNVSVRFTILANGSVSGLKISKSSGKEAVDAAALKVVRNAAPFPPIPAEAGKKSWLMTVPMTFKGR